MEMYETNSDFGLTSIGGEIKAYKKFYTQADYTPWSYHAVTSAKKLKEVPPCVYGAPILTYLNDA